MQFVLLVRIANVDDSFLLVFSAWAGQVHLAVCMLAQLGPFKNGRPPSRYTVEFPFFHCKTKKEKKKSE